MSADVQYIASDIGAYVENYAFLLDMQSNPVVVIDDQSIVVYSNPAFYQLTGLNKESVSGQSIRGLLPRFKRVDSLVSESLSENKTIIYKDTLKHHAYNQILPLIFNINPLVSQTDKKVQGVLITIKEDSQQLIKFFDMETEKLSHRILALSDELRSKLKLINSIFDNSPVGMMILDDKCNIMQINNSGKEILESESSLVGVSCKRFYNAGPEEFENTGRSIIDPVEIKAITDKGRKIILLRCSVKSKDEENLIYETFVDISEIEKARLLSEQAREAAENANKAKGDFLANVTHELQTPLNIIMGYSQLGTMLSDDASLDEVKSDFRKILSSSEDLRLFINNILDMSRAEAGKLIFNKRMELFRPIIARVVDECSILCKEKNIEVELDINGLVDEYEIDTARFKQVIRNLLANAIKFSPESSIIKIAGETFSDYIEIKIIDAGPGIPDDELEVIFSKFEQSTKTRNGSGGTGLGLAICREIISGHNGRVYAENSPQGGAVFIIRFPRVINRLVKNSK